MLIAISLAAFLATFFGGLFAMRFRDKLHLILGFSAGAVLAVAFFDLLPEALELGSAHGISTILSVTALGFLIYTVIDRIILLHSHDDEIDHSHRGKFGAGSLAIHSFLDGLAIGLSFQVSTAVGITVATAVLVHDFSDGINTVSLIQKNGGSRRQALRWLAYDAAAPVVGVIASMFIRLSESSLGIVLALFAGFFLYIGASDLLPESHHAHPTYWTTFMTILGALVLYSAIKVAAI